MDQKSEKSNSLLQSKLNGVNQNKSRNSRTSKSKNSLSRADIGLLGTNIPPAISVPSKYIVNQCRIMRLEIKSTDCLSPLRNVPAKIQKYYKEENKPYSYTNSRVDKIASQSNNGTIESRKLSATKREKSTSRNFTPTSPQAETAHSKSQQRHSGARPATKFVPNAIKNKCPFIVVRQKSIDCFSSPTKTVVTDVENKESHPDINEENKNYCYPNTCELGHEEKTIEGTSTTCLDKCTSYYVPQEATQRRVESKTRIPIKISSAKFNKDRKCFNLKERTGLNTNTCQLPVDVSVGDTHTKPLKVKENGCRKPVDTTFEAPVTRTEKGDENKEQQSKYADSKLKNRTIEKHCTIHGCQNSRQIPQKHTCEDKETEPARTKETGCMALSEETTSRSTAHKQLNTEVHKEVETCCSQADNNKDKEIDQNTLKDENYCYPDTCKFKDRRTEKYCTPNECPNSCQIPKGQGRTYADMGTGPPKTKETGCMALVKESTFRSIDDKPEIIAAHKGGKILKKQTCADMVTEPPITKETGCMPIDQEITFKSAKHEPRSVTVHEEVKTCCTQPDEIQHQEINQNTSEDEKYCYPDTCQLKQRKTVKYCTSNDCPNACQFPKKQTGEDKGTEPSATKITGRAALGEEMASRLIFYHKPEDIKVHEDVKTCCLQTYESKHLKENSNIIEKMSSRSIIDHKPEDIKVLENVKSCCLQTDESKHQKENSNIIEEGNYCYPDTCQLKDKSPEIQCTTNSCPNKCTSPMESKLTETQPLIKQQNRCMVAASDVYFEPIDHKPENKVTHHKNAETCVSKIDNEQDYYSSRPLTDKKIKANCCHPVLDSEPPTVKEVACMKEFIESKPDISEWKGVEAGTYHSRAGTVPQEIKENDCLVLACEVVTKCTDYEHNVNIEDGKTETCCPQATENKNQEYQDNNGEERDKYCYSDTCQLKNRRIEKQCTPKTCPEVYEVSKQSKAVGMETELPTERAFAVTETAVNSVDNKPEKAIVSSSKVQTCCSEIEKSKEQKIDKAVPDESEKYCYPDTCLLKNRRVEKYCTQNTCPTVVEANVAIAPEPLEIKEAGCMAVCSEPGPKASDNKYENIGMARSNNISTGTESPKTRETGCNPDTCPVLAIFNKKHCVTDACKDDEGKTCQNKVTSSFKAIPGEGEIGSHCRRHCGELSPCQKNYVNGDITKKTLLEKNAPITEPIQPEFITSRAKLQTSKTSRTGSVDNGKEKIIDNSSTFKSETLVLIERAKSASASKTNELHQASKKSRSVTLRESSEANRRPIRQFSENESKLLETNIDESEYSYAEITEESAKIEEDSVSSRNNNYKGSEMIEPVGSQKKLTSGYARAAVGTGTSEQAFKSNEISVKSSSVEPFKPVSTDKKNDSDGRDFEVIIAGHRIPDCCVKSVSITACLTIPQPANEVFVDNEENADLLSQDRYFHDGSIPRTCISSEESTTSVPENARNYPEVDLPEERISVRSSAEYSPAEDYQPDYRNPTMDAANDFINDIIAKSRVVIDRENLKPRGVAALGKKDSKCPNKHNQGTSKGCCVCPHHTNTDTVENFGDVEHYQVVNPPPYESFLLPSDYNLHQHELCGIPGIRSTTTTGDMLQTQSYGRTIGNQNHAEVPREVMAKLSQSYNKASNSNQVIPMSTTGMNKKSFSQQYDKSKELMVTNERGTQSEILEGTYSDKNVQASYPRILSKSTSNKEQTLDNSLSKTQCPKSREMIAKKASGCVHCHPELHLKVQSSVEEEERLQQEKNSENIIFKSETLVQIERAKSASASKTNELQASKKSRSVTLRESSEANRIPISQFSENESKLLGTDIDESECCYAETFEVGSSERQTSIRTLPEQNKTIDKLVPSEEKCSEPLLPIQQDSFDEITPFDGRSTEESSHEHKETSEEDSFQRGNSSEENNFVEREDVFQEAASSKEDSLAKQDGVIPPDISLEINYSMSALPESEKSIHQIDISVQILRKESYDELSNQQSNMKDLQLVQKAQSDEQSDRTSKSKIGSTVVIPESTDSEKYVKSGDHMLSSASEGLIPADDVQDQRSFSDQEDEGLEEVSSSEKSASMQSFSQQGRNFEEDFSPKVASFSQPAAASFSQPKTTFQPVGVRIEEVSERSTSSSSKENDKFDVRKELLQSPSEFIDDVIINSIDIIDRLNLKPKGDFIFAVGQSKCPDHSPSPEDSPSSRRCCVCPESVRKGTSEAFDNNFEHYAHSPVKDEKFLPRQESSRIPHNQSSNHPIIQSLKQTRELAQTQPCVTTIGYNSILMVKGKQSGNFLDDLSKAQRDLADSYKATNRSFSKQYALMAKCYCKEKTCMCKFDCFGRLLKYHEERGNDENPAY